jgi:tripartite-type tricarboxylate transporter receptor subunit TctC
MEHHFFSRRQALGLSLGLGLGIRPVWSTAQTTVGVSASNTETIDWPGKNRIKVIVSEPPGGIIDNMVRRFLAPRIGPELQTTMEVVNLPNVTGLGALAKAKPDGYTLGFINLDMLTLEPLLNKAPLPYNPRRDFMPIASICALPMLVIATNKLALSEAPDFASVIERARTKPGSVQCATLDLSASVGQLSLAQLRLTSDLNIEQLQYRNSATLIADALAARFDLMIIPIEPSLIRYINAGNIRALAVVAPARIKEQLPKIPTLGELGFPAANLSSTYGFFAPARTPQQIQEKLNNAINTQSHDAEVRHHLDALGWVAVSGTIEDFVQTINETTSRTEASLRVVFPT